MAGSHIISPVRLGLDSKETEAKIKQKTAVYKDLCETCRIRPKTEQLRYECGMSDLRKTKVWKKFEDSAEGDKKVITGVAVHDTMKTSKGKENVEVHTVGKINKDIYKCITEDIRTDEVIITDERIAHIKERHPSDYERFCGYIPEIIEFPDYILKSAKPNTAMILKEIVDEKEKFQLILRIKTSEDNKNFKNSIITFLKVNERTWNKYLRNKTILYTNK